jgi:hypothetical protein
LRALENLRGGCDGDRHANLFRTHSQARSASEDRVAKGAPQVILDLCELEGEARRLAAALSGAILA